VNDLLTGPEAADLCGVEPCTIRKWRQRGLIEPDGIDERGRPLYLQLTVARAEKATRAKAGRVPGQRAAAPTPGARRCPPPWPNCPSA
jgi:hypothetical protein